MGIILLLLDIFPERWRRWVGAQDPTELEAGFLAAVAAWGYSLFFEGGFAAPLRGLAFFLVLLLAVCWTSRAAFSRAVLAALAFVAVLTAALFAWRQPSHLLICGLLALTPFMQKFHGFCRRLPSRYAAAAGLGLLVAAFWATIPPSAFRFPLDLSRLPPNLLTFYEMHLDNFALGPAQKLAAHVPLPQVQALYGLASPALMVVLNRAAGCPIDLGTFFKISFAFKYAFICCSLLALYLYGGRRFLPALLFSVWALSWNNSASPPLEANHSAVRFLGVPVFFLALWSVRRRPFALLLAVAAPTLWLCALLNPETAFALFAAALVYAWFRWREDGLPARLGRTLALAAAAVPGALLCRGGTVSMFSSGFGGTDFIASPAPFAVILLALIVWAQVAASPDANSPKNAYRAAAAAFLLLWGAYYVNRPWPTNLDIHLYVFGFFAVDLVRAAGLRTVSVPRRVGALMLLAVAAPLLTGSLNDSARDLFWETRRPQSIFHPSGPDQVASGVRVSADFASRLNAARETWMRYSRPGEPCLMLTSHPIFLSAATCFSSLPFADPFQAFTLENDRRESAAIRSSRAKYLFIEPESDLTDDDRRDSFARLRAAIAADYRPREKTPHLDVWERRLLDGRGEQR
ncbi:MAG: hypothetical protein ACHQ2Z_13175 [Elusimicrobiota bacterium]